MQQQPIRDGGEEELSRASDLAALAERALAAARQGGLSIVTAESCTAGRLAALLAAVPGAGDLIHGGFVACTKANKAKALGVPEMLLRNKGGVSPAVAVAMAKGALMRSPAHVAVAITGVAGPEPDEDGNPVGFMCLAVTRRNRQSVHSEKRYGNLGRAGIQERAMADALAALIQAMEEA